MPKPLSKPGQEGEERLLRACTMLVERYVHSNLPANRRGIHAVKLDRERIYQEVRASFNDIVARLVAEIEDGHPEVMQEGELPKTLTRRISIMDNDLPCVGCNRVDRIAVVDYVGGKSTRVQCERCAPEFNNVKTTPEEGHEDEKH